MEHSGTVSGKWGDALDAGFQQIPDVLFRGQAKLGLKALDLAILLNILMHWWGRDALPYPRPHVIAKRVGVSTRTVERRIASMEEMGLIKWLPREEGGDGKMRRCFDLSGLVTKLQALSRGHRLQRGQNRSRRKDDGDDLSYE